MTDKQQELISLILEQLKQQLQQLCDDFADFKADTTEDLKHIKFRLHMIELADDPELTPTQRAAMRLDRLNGLLKQASGDA